MAKQRNIRELGQYIRATRSQVVKAYGLTLAQTTQRAEQLAKQNAKAQFTGRNGRRLSGRLLNSIFSGYDVPTAGLKLPAGFVGVAGIPYGAIHEFGGEIRPKQAKALWIKQYKGKAARYKRLTPKEFWDRLRAQRSAGRRAGKRLARDRFTVRIRGGRLKAVGVETPRGKFTPLFIMADKAHMPMRPYVTPAIREAVKGFPRVMTRRLGKLLSAKFFKD